MHGSCNMAVWELGGLGGNSYSGLRVTRPEGAAAPTAGTHRGTSSSAETEKDREAEAKADRETQREIGGSSSRLLAANFDGFHSEGSRVGPTLTDSVRLFHALCVRACVRACACARVCLCA
eukprot:COSAG03_NODE_3024_length_2280_cov_234.403943_3_plen_121_part_00